MKEELKVITTITIQGKQYYLLEDGNLYEENENKEKVLLDNLNEDSKKIIEKIMDKFRPRETDVIRDGNDVKKSEKKKIEVELPEI